MREVSKHSGVTVDALARRQWTKQTFLRSVASPSLSSISTSGFINFSFPLLLSSTLDFKVLCRPQFITKRLARSWVTADSPHTVSHPIPSHVSGQWGAKLKKHPFHTGPWHYRAKQIARSYATIPVLILINTLMIACLSGKERLTSTSSHMLFLIPVLAASLILIFCTV